METNYSHPANVAGSAIPNNYDANVLVTYKDITDGVATYPTIKVNDLEYRLDRIKSLEKQLSVSNGQISQILENMTVNGWYNPNTDKEEVLRDLCEILNHEPTQDVTITGNISFEVTVSLPLDEVENFDAHYFLGDELTLDSYNSNVSVDSWYVEDTNTHWD